MGTVCRIVSLNKGPVSYAQAFDWQRGLQKARIAGQIPDTLLLLEHDPVITVGRGDRDEADLIASRQSLRRRGIDVVTTDRGGRSTYHAPGQLVGYPIVQLAQPPIYRDVHRYLRCLEEALILALASLGVEATRKEGLTGVWVAECKIAAIGIKVSRWVSMHGFALNIDPDMRPFRQDIVPCGLVDKEVTSLAECAVKATRAGVEQALVAAFCRVFDRVPEIATEFSPCHEPALEQ